MSRMTSVPTTINVQTRTSLATEAQATAANSFRVFEGIGLSDRAPHPTSGILCDPTEDGQSLTHTIVDWCGKGVHDPVTKRVLWMGKGTGNSPGGWAFNTLAIYSETTESWSAVRGFRSPGQPTTAYGIGHTYDNNCVSIRSRKLFKKQFSADTFGSGSFYVFDLDSNAFEGAIAPPTGDNSSFGIGPADVVTTRGPQDRIWYANSTNADTRIRLVEYEIGSSGWKTILAEGAFPNLAPNMNDGGALSFNPRAFGGAGAALLLGGSATAYMVRADTLAVSAVEPAPMSLGLPNNGHLCRNPSGPGWLLFGSDGFVYRTDGATWTKAAALPEGLAGMSFIVIPIDTYGVVWIVRERSSGSRAWLYRA